MVCGVLGVGAGRQVLGLWLLAAGGCREVTLTFGVRDQLLMLRARPANTSVSRVGRLAAGIAGSMCNNSPPKGHYGAS